MSKLVFKNYGGSFQLRIQDAGDLEKVSMLPEALWAATSVVNDSLNCDAAFLRYVDTDGNGRIRTDELKAALAWLFRFLANRSRLSETAAVLRLGDIDVSHPDGEKLRAAAARILANLNASDTGEITLAQIRDVQSIMASAADNGDGIIPPAAAAEADLAGFITAVMDTVGAAEDAGGQPGVDEARLNEFLQEAEAYLAWKGKGEIPPGSETTEIMPWGAETIPAYAMVAGLEEKIEQYFTQCAMVRFDERAQARMQLRPQELEGIDFNDKSAMEARLKESPLALPAVGGVLPLTAAVNPLYADRLLALKEKVLNRALGESGKGLTQKEWEKVKGIFAPYRMWVESKQGARVEKLGEDQLRSYLSGPYREGVGKLIAKDLAAADDLNQIHSLEKLILYQRWLMGLANNFVSLTNLYNPQRRALFEMGTLVIDGREITFCMKVQDRPAHKKIAKESCMYLLYLEITGRQDKDVKFEAVAPVTAGAAGRLRIGKRGIFFTTDGQEWDAQVVDIVINPVNPWETLTAPFQQLAAFVKKQVDKFTRSREEKMKTVLAKPSASGTARDLLLGGGVAIAALGASFGYVTKALSQVKGHHILITLAGLVIIFLLPGVIIGFNKIRKRDMSVLLEASGWAVNAHLRLNAALGRLFTHTPHLPKGARKERGDAVARFVKEIGYLPSNARRIISLSVIFLLLALLILFDIYCGWKLLF